MMDRINEHIEFHEAIDSHKSDVAFLNAVREHVRLLEKQVKDIDFAVRKNDWTRALDECLKSRERFLGS